MSSQWGKIKANLVTESVNTPLQEKLEKMTTMVSSPSLLRVPLRQTVVKIVPQNLQLSCRLDTLVSWLLLLPSSHWL